MRFLGYLTRDYVHVRFLTGLVGQLTDRFCQVREEANYLVNRYDNASIPRLRGIVVYIVSEEDVCSAGLASCSF